jgi:phosphoesterase RecJ-like protein
MGKQAVIVIDDSVPSAYGFLPQIDNIKIFNKNLKGIKFDCFVALDCSDLSRCGSVYRINTDQKVILNIDHHISNAIFGDINWVEPQASSVSEMIYKLYKKLRVPLDKKSALSLYVGIMTDTGSFRYSNTTSFTHEAAAKLLNYNLDAAWIYKKIYENMSFADVKLFVKILPTIKQEFNGKIVWFQIKRSMLGRNISFDLSEEALSFARAIKGVEVAVLFKENLGAKNEIRVNFRSQGKVEVNKIARFFGGGGHKTASGCTVIGRIEEVRRKVLAKIIKSF